PSVTSSTLTRNGAPIPSCEFDQTNYANPDAGTQALGRAVLASRRAIVLMPREPLGSGNYLVAISSGGVRYLWSFSSSAPLPPPLQLAPVCSPRPNVQVAAASAGAGLLRVTLTSQGANVGL